MEGRTDCIRLVTRNLRILFRAVQAHAKYVEKECGLSGAKLWMLYEIHCLPGLKVSELASALTIHPSTCSNMLDKLEKQDLIRRDRSKKDQRAVHLYLTDTGQALLDRAPQPAQGELSQALANLSDEHLASLEKGLEGLMRMLQRKNESAGLIPLPGG